MSLDTLTDHVDDVCNLCITAETALLEYVDSTGQPLESERSYIQDTTQDPLLVICNASVVKRSEGKPSHNNFLDVRPIGLSCPENKCEEASVVHKSEFIEKLSPTRLYNLASEEMQLWLDVSRRDRPIDKLSLQDLVSAADRRVPELGIRACCDLSDSVFP